MEKIIYILILIILENDFYKDIKSVNTINYDFVVNKNYKLEASYIPKDLEEISLEFSCKDKYLINIAKINFENMAKDAKENGFKLNNAQLESVAGGDAWYECNDDRSCPDVIP